MVYNYNDGIYFSNEKEQGKLREIRDNLYVFSADSSYFGRIIASRSSNGYHDGENVFDLLKIPNDDRARIAQMLYDGNVRTNLVQGTKDIGSRREVLFMSLFGREARICIAMEMLDRPDAASVCPDVLSYTDMMAKLAFGLRAEGDRETGINVGNIDEIKDVTELASTLVGVDCSFGVSSRELIPTSQGAMLARGEYAAAVIFMLLEARRFSLDRRLFISVSSGVRYPQIALWYDGERAEHSLHESCLSEPLAELDIPISFICDKSRYICRVTPFVSDPSLVGLKHPNTLAYKVHMWE